MDECKWIYYDEDMDYWKTECDNLFSLFEGTPEENQMKYCCYCGKPIKQILKG